MSGMRSLSAGMVFAGDFVVQRALAEGGMGAVYVALQRSTGKERALKVMHPNLAASPASRERFVQEARVGSQIDSDHVVEVVGAGVDAETGMPWLAMELLQGEELSKRMERGPLPVDEAREVFDQLCDALGKAHARGVVHRDLKPENVFIGTARRRGVPFTLKILDFGIAKILKDNQTAATVTTAIGSPLWMSPEQGDSNAKLRPATDVWALGLMAFHALTGKVYWRQGNSETPSLQAILTEVMVMPIVPPSQRAAEMGVGALVPPGFDEWFMGCVQRDPTQRFTDANVAWTALTSVLGSGARASVTSQPSVPATQPLVQPTQVVSQPVVSPTVSWSTTQGVSAPAVVTVKRVPAGLIAGGALVALVGIVGAAVAMTRGSGAEGGASNGVVTEARTDGATVGQAGHPAGAVRSDNEGVADCDVPRDDETFEAFQVRCEQRAGDTPSQGATDGASPEPRDGPVARGDRTNTQEQLVRGNASLGGGDSIGGEGNLDPNAVARLIRGQLGGIRSCYERGLRTNPTLSGRVEVRFTIGTAGRITSASSSGMSEAPEVGSCVVSRIRGLVFPAPEGGSVDFSFPFTFNPGY